MKSIWSYGSLVGRDNACCALPTAQVRLQELRADNECCPSACHDFSQAIAAAVRASGATFLEAPVSGSKKPAEDGKLIFLCAGE
jgi:hypothetical protein